MVKWQIMRQHTCPASKKSQFLAWLNDVWKFSPPSRLCKNSPCLVRLFLVLLEELHVITMHAKSCPPPQWHLVSFPLGGRAISPFFGEYHHVLSVNGYLTYRLTRYFPISHVSCLLSPLSSSRLPTFTPWICPLYGNHPSQLSSRLAGRSGPRDAGKDRSLGKSLLVEKNIRKPWSSFTPNIVSLHCSPSSNSGMVSGMGASQIMLRSSFQQRMERTALKRLH